jgi:SAM-dependent methyltransferase
LAAADHCPFLLSAFVFPSPSLLAAAHPVLVAAATAEEAAAASAQSPEDLATAQAERKAARLAKAAHKQSEFAEKRRSKAALLMQDASAAASAVSAVSAAESSCAIPSAAAPRTVPSSSPAAVLLDGSESAPFGNFHTYYRFNAIQQRLQFVPSQLAAEILRLKRARRASQLPVDPEESSLQRFSFLDVGCNEGNLTIGLMQHLLAGLRGESDSPTIAEVDASAMSAAAAANSNYSNPASSGGSSNSPSAASSSSSASTVLVAAPFRSTQLHAVGVDIDPELISRAQAKIAPTLAELKSKQTEDEAAASLTALARTPLPTLCFETVDVMQAGAVDSIRALLAKSVAEATPSSTTATAASPACASLSSSPPFDLICCYSITLWIHLQHGDEGLRSFLRCLSEMTSHLILEPQPWKCYRNVRERWRRCGKEDPPRMAELKWRQDVEDRMVEFMTRDLGMRLRVDLGSTKWQRRVLWFEKS